MIMQLLGYKMENEELVATVLSDKEHLFKYTFDVSTPEYEILNVLEEINEHVDNGFHPLGCTIIKNYDFRDVKDYSL
ncbi:Uncharacterised protein [Staphylococcus kloosii]|jgi:hypothetical protein|nr:Uncharacterised protein [Staphylococcus kloosii]